MLNHPRLFVFIKISLTTSISLIHHPIVIAPHIPLLTPIIHTLILNDYIMTRMIQVKRTKLSLLVHASLMMIRCVELMSNTSLRVVLTPTRLVLGKVTTTVWNHRLVNLYLTPHLKLVQNTTVVRAACNHLFPTTIVAETGLCCAELIVAHSTLIVLHLGSPQIPIIFSHLVVELYQVRTAILLIHIRLIISLLLITVAIKPPIHCRVHPSRLQLKGPVVGLCDCLVVRILAQKLQNIQVLHSLLLQFLIVDCRTLTLQSVK